MFSIAAINDTDTRGQWEPLAPSKEAQEFYLSQKYHEGLLKLQSRDYLKAQELFEAVLQDPLISGSQLDSCASDGHLLQLRFLSLKNLATVFLEQGSKHFENALRCYLQAVEIDANDSVVWNQLGILSCSMGLLSTSRWAFEQGLLCSPNNWNCMEKLLEILIAIGDETACLSISDLILRHWPCHSRAIHVKKTIEDGELTPFAPRGIDKLEPKHARLKFSNKRKAPIGEEDRSSKRVNQNLEICLSVLTWEALADEVVGILSLVSGKGNQLGTQNWQKFVNETKPMHATTAESEIEKSKDIRLLAEFKIAIKLPSCSEFVSTLAGLPDTAVIKLHSASDIGKLTSVDDDHHQERRSTRLESLRSRKPGKEELDNSSGKRLAKTVFQFLGPFILGHKRNKDGILNDISQRPDIPVYSSSQEHADVMKFVCATSKNYGAYHLGHLLLEEIAHTEITYQESIVKFLELDKLTRAWQQDRAPLCSLFLAELYYDSALDAVNESNWQEFFLDASYHLCKVIEWAALHSTGVPLNAMDSEVFECFNGNVFLPDTSGMTRNSQTKQEYKESVPQESKDGAFVVDGNDAFWIRFYWLSASLSAISGSFLEAIKKFSLCFSILKNLNKANGSDCCIRLPHCKLIRWLSPERVASQINLLRIQTLLKRATGLMDKLMYKDCIELLAPFLHFEGDTYTEIFSGAFIDDKPASDELLALDVLISASERVVPMDIEVYLSSHRRKLLLLTVAAGLNDLPDESSAKKTLQKTSFSDYEHSESVQMQWKNRVAQEVKEISHCASLVKDLVDQDGSPNRLNSLASIIGDIQSTLLRVIYGFGKTVLGHGISGSSSPSQEDHMENQCLVEAATAFCKLQHVDPTVPIKMQVDLIASIHDLLAEFGLCCAGKDSEGKEGIFLKLAIKHLLSLDVKLKSSFHLLNERSETKQSDGHQVDQDKIPMDQSNSLCSSDIAIDGKRDNCFLAMSANEGLASEPLSLLGDQGDSEKGLELVKEDTDLLPLQDQNLDTDMSDRNSLHVEAEREKVELGIDNALDQSFFCLYGLDLRSSQDSSCEDDLATHKNTNRGDYQTKEQCADVFQYILPYAKVSSRTGMVKLRRVLRAIRKHFPRPLDGILDNNSINKFLDSPSLSEDKIFFAAGLDENNDAIMNILYACESNEAEKRLSVLTSGLYSDVYSNLYYYIALAEEISATDKFPGFVLNKEGEEFIEQNAGLLIYDLIYNPLRFESWQKLANVYDEEVDLLLNDGSKHVTIADWRKNSSLLARVERGRRRSRRCMLMSLCLARTPSEKSQIHELLGLVYYDTLQNVVPFYDQRTVLPMKDAEWFSCCMDSLKNFEKAFALKPDWLHAFYLGKLCVKMSYSPEKAFSYYNDAIKLNPTAVDPFYRMHASRLKLLGTCGVQNADSLRIVSLYCFSHLLKENVFNILSLTEQNQSEKSVDAENDTNHGSERKKMPAENHFQNVWCLLFDDCISALRICTDGELKHYHKARYAIAQGLYKRNENGDLERAKDELSFCFKSSRSSFTINMWEIDSMTKKTKRKTPSHSGNKRNLEVNLPESSRKFITCIRKYILLYLELLEKLKDLCMLEKAYAYLRTDRRFALCIGDIVPLALGRYIKVLTMLILDAEAVASSDSPYSIENLLEKMFHILTDHMNTWGDISTLPEIKCPEISEAAFYLLIHRFIYLLEHNARLDTLEGINEKLRKRFKNPKLASPECAKICRHASFAWCHSILVKLASITPMIESGVTYPSDCVGNGLLLFVDLQQNELYSSLENDIDKTDLERRWCNEFSKLRNLRVRQVLDNNMEAAMSLLKSAYSFFRDTSCGTFPSGINLYTTVFSQLVCEEPWHSGNHGIDLLDLSVPRKLLVWAFTLVHGYYSNISAVVRYCEDNTKLKMRRGTTTMVSCSTSASAAQTNFVKERIIPEERTGIELSSTPLGSSTNVPGDISISSSNQCTLIKTVNLVEEGEEKK